MLLLFYLLSFFFLLINVPTPVKNVPKATNNELATACPVTGNFEILLSTLLFASWFVLFSGLTIMLSLVVPSFLFKLSSVAPPFPSLSSVSPDPAAELLLLELSLSLSFPLLVSSFLIS